MTDHDQTETLTDLLDEAQAVHYWAMRDRCAGCGDPWPCLTHRLAKRHRERRAVRPDLK